MKVNRKISVKNKKVTSVRLNYELVERLKMLAKEDGRSFNNFVERFLEQA